MKKLLIAIILTLTTAITAMAGEIPKKQLRAIRLTANWCSPCQQMNAAYASKAAKAELAKYELFSEVDVDKRPDFPQYYKIDKLPCLLILDHDGKMVRKATGLMTEKQLVEFLRDRTDTSTRGTPREVLFGGTINLQPIVFGIGAFLWWLFG